MSKPPYSLQAAIRAHDPTGKRPGHEVWAEMVRAGTWRVPRNRDGTGRKVRLTPQTLDRDYPADIFISHREALDLLGGLPKPKTSSSTPKP